MNLAYQNILLMFFARYVIEIWITVKHMCQKFNLINLIHTMAPTLQEITPLVICLYAAKPEQLMVGNLIAENHSILSC